MALFSKRHYNFLSVVINTAYNAAPSNTPMKLVIAGFSQHLAYALQRDNPSFNYTKFVETSLSSLYPGPVLK